MPRYPFTPEVLDAMPEECAELFRGLEITIINKIADRLKNDASKINETTLQEIRVLRSHGMQLDEIQKAISKTSGISERVLDDLLVDVVSRNQEYYTELITLADLVRPDVLVDAVFIEAIKRETLGTFRNITRSMGFLVDSGRAMLPPAQAYQWALNSATMQVQSGATSYGQAIANATRQLADSGLKVVDYQSGRHDQIDVAVRRAVLTGVSQISDKFTEQNAEYLGTRYYEISAHAGARDVPGPNGWESHKDWQGKVYYESESGEPDPLGKYPDLAESTGYGYVDGLMGANCRHRRYPWIEGVSKRTYTDDELKNIDPPAFEYEGRKYTHYAATQKQRQIENAVRHWKRRVAAATDDEDKAVAQARVARLQEKYVEFSRIAGLRTQPERMSIYRS